MVLLANGELVRHYHAVEAGILVEDNHSSSAIKKKHRTSKSK